MGHSLAISTFTVTKSNPSGNIVRFTITDTANILTTQKMIRSVILDAIYQFVVAERADMITNGDQSIVDQLEAMQDGAGDRVAICTALAWTYASKLGNLTLTDLTNIAETGTITATAPFEDV